MTPRRLNDRGSRHRGRSAATLRISRRSPRARRGLAPSAQPRIAASRALVEEVLRRGEAVYGVNTGFGALKSVRVPDEDVEPLQLNLIRSHAAGYGPELEPEAVRLMLALRAHSLALGMSGVRPLLIDHLLAMLAADVLPVVRHPRLPGASGD